MTHHTWPLAILLLSTMTLSACADAELASLQTDVVDLQTELAAQVATIDDQQATIDAQQAAMTDLTARLVALEGAGFLTVETDPVASEAGYLTEAALTALPAGSIEQADVDAWNATAAEVDGTSDAVVGSRIDLLEAEDQVLAADITALDGELSLLGVAVTTLQGGLGVAEGDIDALETDLAVAVTDIGALQTGTLGWIDDDLTLAVPGDHALLSDALAWLDDYAIDNDATVTIALATGTHVEPDAVIVSHRDGHRIEIVGTGASQTTLEFADSDGIVVTGGTALGSVAELAITGMTGGYAGILVSDSSALLALDAVDISSWTYGINVAMGGVLTVVEDAAIYLDGNTYGVNVEYGGMADVTGAEATDSSGAGFRAVGGQLIAEEAVATASGTYGFYASYGGIIHGNESVADGDDSTWYGYRVVAGSIGRFHGATAENNTIDGIRADGGSYIAAPNATAQNNGDEGFQAGMGATLVADNSFSTSNDGEGYACVDNGALQALNSTALGNDAHAYQVLRNGYMRVSALEDITKESDDHETDYISGL